MTPETIIEQVAADGVLLALFHDGRIKATGEHGAVNRWSPILREHKPGIVASLRESAKLIVEPASSMASPIYWEAMDGTWHGPVKPEYLGRTGRGDGERFWVIVSYRGTVQWIWSDLLRSRQAYERRSESTE